MNTSLAKIRRHTDSVHKNTLFQIKDHLKCNTVISSYSILKTFKNKIIELLNCIKYWLYQILTASKSIYYWLIDTWSANEITTKIRNTPFSFTKTTLHRRSLLFEAPNWQPLWVQTHWGYITPLKSPFILKTRSLNLPQKLAEKRNIKTLDT